MTMKAITALILLGLSTGAMAAKEIRHSEMAGMSKQVGSISVDIRNGTIDEANQALSKKADEAGAKYYRVVSIGMDGMGSDVSATAEIYK
ncbi:TPA: DUF1471 domain-containing protein [Klebsiella aerogenes]|nr:DUF1471 domain-containing protein [Klebsiella aerogenes]